MMRYIITLFLVCSAWCICAQTTQEIDALMHINTPAEHQEASWRELARNNVSEFDLMFSALFLTYKTLLSSQDVGRCSFHPSCSAYAIDAIKKQGPIVGIINFFDRFTRCNGLSPSQYDIHPETQLLHDPVE